MIYYSILKDLIAIFVMTKNLLYEKQTKTSVIYNIGSLANHIIGSAIYV